MPTGWGDVCFQVCKAENIRSQRAFPSLTDAVEKGLEELSEQ
jgi:hypothetical protein